MNDFDEVYKKRDLVSYILSVGEARYILSQLLEHQLLNRGKHDPWWDQSQSDYEENLEELQMEIRYIREQLMEIEDRLS